MTALPFDLAGVQLCSVVDCTEPSDGPLVYNAVALAPICDVHSLAIQADDLASMYQLNPMRARGWRLVTQLDRPGPVLYPPDAAIPTDIAMSREP